MLVIADNLTAATPRISAALRARDAGAIRQFAAALQATGVDILDLNLGFSAKGAEVAAWLIREVWETTRLPLCIDTAHPEVMRAGMTAAAEAGVTPVPFINSFSLEERKVEGILPLATEFSAPIVGYCVRDVVPQSPEERIEVAIELVALADGAGVPRDRLYLDPILFPLTTFQDDFANVLAFFKALPQLFDPPVRTMVAVSNIGHGLAQDKRRVVEGTVLPMLAALGLDAVLVNALDLHLRDVLTVLRAAESGIVFSGADLSGAHLSGADLAGGR
jgi:5-methyltetrahydrofolate--homocysteine methyltransferase